eukprot:gene1429-12560_t
MVWEWGKSLSGLTTATCDVRTQNAEPEGVSGAYAVSFVTEGPFTWADPQLTSFVRPAERWYRIKVGWGSGQITVLKPTDLLTVS